MIAGQPGFVEIHAYLPALPADNVDRGNLVHLLDGVVQLRGEAPQIVVAIALGPERQGQNGHIIDRARLNARRRGARRHQVEVCGYLVVQTHNGLLFVLADEKTHYGHRHARAGCRVDVLDARNLPQELLHRFGNTLLDFARGGARHLDEDVDHGDDDLRLLLPGKFNHSDDAQKKRGRHEKRCELGVDESGGEPPGDAEARRVVHFVVSWIVTRAPSASNGVGITMILSPAVRPERTSRWSPRPSPSVTKRSRAVSPSTT